jgi:hypothetical protein
MMRLTPSPRAGSRLALGRFVAGLPRSSLRSSPRSSRLALRGLLALFVALAALAGPARADTEWVLMLDNSSSMSSETPYSENGTFVKNIPAQDPDRLSVIATLVFRAMMGPDDKLTILTYDSRHGPNKYTLLPNDPKQIRALFFGEQTFMVGPLTRGREILDQSTAQTRIFVLATDGAPNPETPGGPTITAADARRLLGLDPGPARFEVVSLALASSPESRAMMREFLAPLGRLEQIDDPTRLVTAFTDVFARSIRSRPETGRLEPGGSYTFTVGKYVTDVWVAAATERTTGPFVAALTADARAVPPVDAGDAGCDRPPCHAYQVFKTAHDPEQASTFVLSLPKGNGAIAYGIVMRYELAAEIVSAPSKARLGEPLEVVARIVWQGSTFNDPAFFAADGFKATLRINGQEAPLTARDDGTFVGTVTAGGPVGSAKLEAVFANRWISLVGDRTVTLDEWIPLELKVAPIDLGTWTGARGPSRRCIDLDLAGSVNADKVPIEAQAAGLAKGYRLEAPSPLAVKDGKARVCLVAPGCCTASTPATLTVRGVDPHYHPGAIEAPIAYRVRATPFLTCYWPHIAGAIGAVIFIIIVIGFVRPRDFDKEEVIRLAKTEQALTRAGGRRLRDLPGGKRGFYRNARVAFDGAGNAVRSPGGASFVLRAAKGDPVVEIRGGLEEKDPRTRKFQPVATDKGPVYLRRNIVYRSGEFFFRLG